MGIVIQMFNTSRSMRCYTKGTISSPLAQFSCFAENQNDSGDAGGIPVFTFWPISHFGKSTAHTLIGTVICLLSGDRPGKCFLI